MSDQLGDLAMSDQLGDLAMSDQVGDLAMSDQPIRLDIRLLLPKDWRYDQYWDV